MIGCPSIWLWFALGAGIWFARSRRRLAPARAALGLVVAYIASMWAGSQWAERETATAVAEAGYETPVEVVASPPPVNPFARQMIYSLGDRIGYGAASLADGGTLFLDEIGEMDLDLQSKLLRFVQNRPVPARRKR